MKLLDDEQANRRFLHENMMGPNAVRLMDELTAQISLSPGMRILDLGCGTGLTSIYLAKKFDVTLFAVDLWIDADANYRRFQQFGLQDNVIPLHLDVTEGLPFAKGYFDAVVSVDAFHYFGAEPGFLEQQIVPLIKPDGVIAITVPGLKNELIDGQPPKELLPYWVDDMNFFTCEHWHRLWSNSGQVRVEFCQPACSADLAWQEWLECNNPYAIRDRDMMALEAGRYFNFVQMIARLS
jgi:cyclopropane fatty-acyl-phospholipid synthase-like methyltransferase